MLQTTIHATRGLVLISYS